MAKAKKQSHCTFRNEKLFCSHCGGEQVMPLPMEMKMFSEKITAFEKMHSKCKPTWQQSMPDESLPVNEKAYFWLRFGERGLSSETIFNVLMHGKSVASHHPHDPDDFRRCYMLLRMVPEWKDSLYKMKEVSAVWSCLVDNWDNLTVMLEEQLAGKRNDMYQFMRKLGC